VNLLLKSAEQLSLVAALHSRITHAFPKRATEHRALAQSSLKRSNERLTQLLAIKEGLSAPLHARVLHLRSTNLLELQETQAATLDLRSLIQLFPTSEEASAARLTLSGILADQKDHAAVLTILLPLRQDATSARYGLALYRSAWALFNLTQFEEALKTVTEHTHALSTAEQGTSDQIIRENLLLDAAVFYAEAIERASDCCKIEAAWSKLKALGDESLTPRIALRLAKLLRSHRRTPELENLVSQFLAQAPVRSETMEALLLQLDDAMNHHRFGEVSLAASRITQQAEKYPGRFEKAVPSLTDTLERITQLTLQNEKAEGVQVLLKVQAQLAESLVRLVGEIDVRTPKIRYQLGETLYRLQDFERSASEYRKSFEKAEKGSALASDVSRRSISALHQALWGSRAAAAKASPGALDFSKLPAFQAIPEKTLQLAHWIDEHPVSDRQSILPFVNELHRALLSLGQTELVIQRSLSFARSLGEAPESQTLAELALDLRIATRDWTKLLVDVKSLQHSELSRRPEFKQRLQNLEGEVSYQLLTEQLAKKGSEAGQERVAALTRFQADFKGHEKAAEASILLAETYQSLGRTQESESLWDSIASLPVTNPSRGKAHRHRIERAIESKNLEAAVQEELLFASWLRTQKREGVEKSLLHAIELTLALPTDSKSRVNLIEKLRSESSLCAQKTDNALAACLLISADPRREALLLKGRPLPEAAQAYAALVRVDDSLVGSEKKQHAQVIEQVRQILTGWAGLPRAFAQETERTWESRFAGVLATHRESIREQRRIEADEWAIKRRTRAIQDAEKLLPLATALGPSKLAEIVIRWAASLHEDAANDLRAIRKPKGLSPAERAQFEAQLERLATPFQERSVALSKVALSKPAQEKIHNPEAPMTSAPEKKENL